MQKNTTKGFTLDTLDKENESDAGNKKAVKLAYSDIVLGLITGPPPEKLAIAVCQADNMPRL